MAPVFDTSRVSPLDAVATLRSLRRRFGQVLTLAPAAAAGIGDPDELLRRRPGPGLSPIEHAAWVAAALPRLEASLRRVLVEDGAVVDLPPVDVDPPVPGAGADTGADAALDVVARLGHAAEASADFMASVHGADWTRRGCTGEGRPVSALDIARLAVRIGIEHLNGAEQAVAALVKQPRG
jgi:hypothetical protein